MIALLGSSVIIWRSQQQKCVAVSTTEAEYIAASESVKDIIWMKRLLNGITGCVITSTLYVDNQSAIKIIKNPEHHKRTKHIDISYHFIREKFMEGIFNLDYISSGSQMADILTKPIPHPQFENLRNFMIQVLNI